MPTRLASSIRRMLIAVPALLTVSCLEPAVRQTLSVELYDDGSAELTLQVLLLAPDELHGRPRLERRIADLRDALLSGTDEWHRVFDGLSPTREDLSWRKQDGELVSFEHRASVASGDELVSFFADLGAGLYVETDAATTSLALFPGSAARATRRQRLLVERTLDDWSEALAAYVDSAAALFFYLDSRPERASALFRHLFDDVVSDSLPTEDLADGEEELIGRLEDQMGDVLQILLVDEAEAYSLDEISQLVFDPFPARLRFMLPGPILESEGFDEVASRAVEIGGLGLWRSFETLEGSWVEPELLQLYVAASTAEDGTTALDLDALSAAPRRADALASANEIRTALEERLQPAPVYRVTWSRDRG